MKSARLALVVCNHCLCFNIFPILPLYGMMKNLFGVVGGGVGVWSCLIGMNAVDAVVEGVVESLQSQKPEKLDTTRRTRKGTYDESLRNDIFCVLRSADNGEADDCVTV